MSSTISISLREKRCRSCACTTRISASRTRMPTGHVTNAVLIMHGTGGSGRSLINERFSGVLFQKGQLLDAEKYFIILPDGIGHGNSSKPSDGLRMHFPQYSYQDMVLAQYPLAHQGPGSGPSAPGHGHLHGMHAHLHVGRGLSGLHGCADAARLPAGADRGTQSPVARSDHGCHSQ